MRPIRKTRHAMMIFGAGALSAYFFDPDSGPQRRARIVDQVRSMTSGMPSMSDGMTERSDHDSNDNPTGDSRADESARDGEGSSGPIDLATGRPLAEANTGG